MGATHNLETSTTAASATNTSDPLGTQDWSAEQMIAKVGDDPVAAAELIRNAPAIKSLLLATMHARLGNAHVQQVLLAIGKEAADFADMQLLTDHKTGHGTSSTATPAKHTKAAGTNTLSTATYQQAMAKSIPWTRPLAEAAMNAFMALSPAQQTTWIATWVPTGQIGPMLRALNPADVALGGRYVDSLRNIEQRVQREAAISEAAIQGITSEADMIREQATFMHSNNVAAASATSAGSAPTAAEIASQQQTQVAQTSIAPQAQTLTATREARLTREANAQVNRFVTWVTSAHPTLRITAANFRVAVRDVWDRGDGIVAFAGGGSPPVCVVGEAFTLAASKNPAYVLSTVVHELWGHNEYGPYGAPGVEYGLEVYDQAAATMPGYVKPTGAGRTSELDAYAYQETEMYSLMKEVAYYTPNAPADKKLLDSINYDPAPVISGRVGMIATQYEPKVARSLTRGLYQRFRIDPRLTPAALAAFAAGVRIAYSAADAASILR
jgi:hypothetical protein